VRLDEPGPEFAPTAPQRLSLSGGHTVRQLDTSGAIDVAAERPAWAASRGRAEGVGRA
jgi:valyl-tRNA synthetase